MQIPNNKLNMNNKLKHIQHLEFLKHKLEFYETHVIRSFIEDGQTDKMVELLIMGKAYGVHFVSIDSISIACVQADNSFLL